MRTINYLSIAVLLIATVCGCGPKIDREAIMRHLCSKGEIEHDWGEWVHQPETTYITCIYENGVQTRWKELQRRGPRVHRICGRCQFIEEYVLEPITNTVTVTQTVERVVYRDKPCERPHLEGPWYPPAPMPDQPPDDWHWYQPMPVPDPQPYYGPTNFYFGMELTNGMISITNWTGDITMDAVIATTNANIIVDGKALVFEPDHSVTWKPADQDHGGKETQ